jgi:hypothetical protein
MPRQIKNQSDHIAKTSAKVMVNGDTLFNITGDVLIYALVSECYTANNATASTLQFSITNNDTATSQTISSESATLASKAPKTSVLAQLGSLSNAPVISNASGVGAFPWGAIRAAGNSILTSVIGVGSTTGTWKHYIRYEPLEDGATITPAF